jgi:hypothetical protein
MDDFVKHSMDTIIKSGHQVLYVFPDSPDQVAFAYTVGRSVKDRPELLMTGPMVAAIMTNILNDVAEYDDSQPINAGDLLPADTVLVDYPARVVAVDPREAQMFQAINFFGEDLNALQILWPDAEGRFPGDPGCTIDETFQPRYPLRS